jgi:predicted dehydrogenase
MLPVRIAAIGAAHGHAYAQVDALLGAGAVLTWFFDESPEVCARFAQRYPQVRIARDEADILNAPDVALIVGTVQNDRRADLGMRAMLHGKHYLCAKPGFTTLEQLAAARRAQAQAGRIWHVFFSERLTSAATVRALELVRAGRIGRVVQTVGLGPHRLFQGEPRPAWMFRRSAYGGILNDLASHQIDQFLIFTDSADAAIVSAQVGQAKFHAHPEFDDFGDLLLRSDRATGYIRVDWLTANGLPTWGDVRLMLLGTDGTIEVRKTIDPAGQPGGDHLFVTDHTGVERIDCRAVVPPYPAQLLTDLLDDTRSAMSQAHCFTVCELALRAQAAAVRLTFTG